jgi:hypothetical protein
MKKTRFVSVAKALAGSALLVAAPLALAGGPQVDWSVTVGSGGYPARVYSPPPAVYVQPQPVYVRPQPVYVPPAPVYVHPAAVVQYGTPYYGHPGRPHKHYKHHWKHRHHHHD